MMRSSMLALALLFTLQIGAAHAGWRHACARECCESSCCETPCSYQTVERTVLVPEYYRAQRTIQVQEYRPENYERKYTVLKPIPESYTVMREYCTYTPKTTMRTEHYTVCQPVYKTITQQCTVMVPHTEPAKCCNPCCGGCGHCGACTVTVCRPEVRTRNIQVCDWQYEQKSREVPCVEMIPEVKQKQVTLTKMRYEPEVKTMICVRMTPVLVDRVVEVPACRMVEKKITCRVPVCGACSF